MTKDWFMKYGKPTVEEEKNKEGKMVSSKVIFETKDAK